MSSSWRVIHSSADASWRTPPALYAELNREFGFALDAAATAENALAPEYLNEAQDALEIEWPTRGPVWLNPPYGREVGRWLEKAWLESRRGLTVVVLVMACTETRWWREFVWKADEVRFIQGRVRFLDRTGQPRAAAPKGSALVVFRPHWEGPPRAVLYHQQERTDAENSE